ncbi:hypothetical protein CERSUDRAFT_104641 [Gelatoporia subvermispora B]|uniref:Uncharacterized protein n=1 Tax=Ceriporiopsis subvermispora (strain B) TaxID=914234 RepID=M2R0I3_CERS8|nr:hypothetical protein CERSUDRAFT_104641 [Gelatoporia subvermispora B]
MMITTTIAFVAGAQFTFAALMANGADGYLEYQTQSSAQLEVVKDAATVVNFWLADSLLLHRAFLVWNGNMWIMALPFLTFVGYIGVGITLLVATTQPGASFGAEQVISLGTAFWSISVAIETCASLLIAMRLIIHRKQIQVLGDNHGKPYMSVAAIFIESAAAYAICGLVYIACYVRQVPASDFFATLFNMSSSLAPVIIVLRIALGATDTYPTTNAGFTSRTISFAKVRNSGNTSSQSAASVAPSSDEPNCVGAEHTVHSAHAFRGVTEPQYS